MTVRLRIVYSAAALLLAIVLSMSGARADDSSKKSLDIYCIDISASVGNATLIVSPSGETLLLDAGPPRSELRTLDVLKQADVKQIDYLLNTHFCADHFGASAALAQQIP